MAITAIKRDRSNGTWLVAGLVSDFAGYPHSSDAHGGIKAQTSWADQVDGAQAVLDVDGGILPPSATPTWIIPDCLAQDLGLIAEDSP